MHARSVTWRQREPPLEPRALAAPLDSLARLRAALASRPGHGVRRLRALRFAGGVVLLGDAAALPCVRGGTYLGRDAGARGLLVPTLLEPDVPIELFERALRRRLGGPPDTLAVLPGRRLVVPIGDARPLASGSLLE